MTLENCIEPLSSYYNGDIVVHSLQDPSSSRDKIANDLSNATEEMHFEEKGK